MLDPFFEHLGHFLRDMFSEEWALVSGFVGSYEVSNLGRVKSTRRRVWNGYSWFFVNERILKPRKGTSGYFMVSLWKDGVKYDKSIHSLVCSAFNGEKPGAGFEVDHIDGDKINNAYTNLRWVSHYENMHNSATSWKIKESVRRRPVAQCLVSGEVISVYNSITDASRSTGVNLGNIASCVSGNKKHKTAGGYLWKYIDKSV